MNQLFKTLESSTHTIGVLTHMDYSNAIIASNDYLVSQAQGVPLNCFLLAIPFNSEEELILLKVNGLADLESNRESKAIKENLARHGAIISQIDAETKKQIELIGYSAKIMGSFYLEDNKLKFGSDVEKVFSYSSYTVVKPYGKTLSLIASYCRPNYGTESIIEKENNLIEIGRVRYTETERTPDLNAKVLVDVRDFIGKKTFLAGQSRSGKSNTVKIITQKVFDYSIKNKNPIGQIIFDPQGEYANDNQQDKGSISSIGDGKDVVIYRTKMKYNGSYEKPLLVNFLEEENLQLLWHFFLAELDTGASANANYISGLKSLDYDKPDLSNVEVQKQKTMITHYNRRRLALYAFMKQSKYEGAIKNFFINIGKNNVSIAEKELGEYGVTASHIKEGEVIVPTVEAAYQLFLWLADVAFSTIPSKNPISSPVRRNIEANKKSSIKNKETLIESSLFTEDLEEAKDVEEDLDNSSSIKLSESWLRDFEDDGEMGEWANQFFSYVEKGRNGVIAAFNRIKELHSSDSEGDMRKAIWEDLEAGRLIIIDLSKGSSIVTTRLSEMIVNSILDNANRRFTDGEKPVNIQLIVEEAHNLFRRDGAKDSRDPWVRVSKEAAKYSIGLVYATQEVTSVDPQILSNTSNWIVAHLNSSQETSALARYYTFSDWQSHLINSESKGFVRMKTESSPFVVPVQIDLFNPNASKDWL